MILSGNPFSAGYYLITADGSSGNNTVSLLRTDTKIKLSTTGATPFSSGGSNNVPTDSLGLKSPFAITWKIPVLSKLNFAGRLTARIYWIIGTGSAGTPKGKLELDVKNNGVAIGGLNVATSGVERNLQPTSTAYSELFVVDIPAVVLLPATTLDIVLTPRVTTVSGSGGSVAVLQVKVDPTGAGTTDSMLEFV